VLLDFRTVAVGSGHNGSATVSAADVVFEALTAAFPPLPGSSMAEIRRSGDEAVLVFRWRAHPHLFGVSVSLTRTHRRLTGTNPRRTSTTGSAPSTCGSWKTSRTATCTGPGVAGSMTTSSSAGLRGRWTNASAPMSWTRQTRTVDCVSRSSPTTGCTPRPLHAARSGDAGRWVTVYENNDSGKHYLGQATVVPDTPGVARRDYVELIDDPPSTLVLAVVRCATHAPPMPVPTRS
jgi:hypothetical protein